GGEAQSADLHLDVGEATSHVARHLGPQIVRRLVVTVEPAAGIDRYALAAAAKQFPNRPSGELAGDVPESNVDATERARSYALAGAQRQALEPCRRYGLDQSGIHAAGTWRDLKAPESH